MEAEISRYLSSSGWNLVKTFSKLCFSCVDWLSQYYNARKPICLNCFILSFKLIHYLFPDEQWVQLLQENYKELTYLESYPNSTYIVLWSWVNGLIRFLDQMNYSETKTAESFNLCRYFNCLFNMRKLSRLNTKKTQYSR